MTAGEGDQDQPEASPQGGNVPSTAGRCLNAKRAPSVSDWPSTIPVLIRAMQVTGHVWTIPFYARTNTRDGGKQPVVTSTAGRAPRGLQARMRMALEPISPLPLDANAATTSGLPCTTDGWRLTNPAPVMDDLLALQRNERYGKANHPQQMVNEKGQRVPYRKSAAHAPARVVHLLVRQRERWAHAAAPRVSIEHSDILWQDIVPVTSHVRRRTCGFADPRTRGRPGSRLGPSCAPSIEGLDHVRFWRLCRFWAVMRATLL